MNPTTESVAVHHLELWTRDLAAAAPSWDWLLTTLGWTPDDGQWEDGRIWTHPSDTYVVLEQSPALALGGHDRMRPGINHFALNCASRAVLDNLRSEAAAVGWTEMFGDPYPHAGGPDHTAVFLENSEGFEVEVVAIPGSPQ